jgi:hypothetical protein
MQVNLYSMCVSNTGTHDVKGCHVFTTGANLFKMLKSLSDFAIKCKLSSKSLCIQVFLEYLGRPPTGKVNKGEVREKGPH